MKKDQITKGKIQDKKEQCQEGSFTTNTDFLDLHQQSISIGIAKGTKHAFAGGYEEAERKVLVFLSDYLELDEDDMFCVVRARPVSSNAELSHRDYLGSLIGIGISRSKVGDILVDEKGADIIVLKSIGTFLKNNYTKAGRIKLDVEILPISQLSYKETEKKEITCTVASVRLDNIISAAFGISRVKAVDAIRQGLVFVDNIEVLKVDKQIENGAKLVLRHKGKCVLKETGEKSRKNRIYIKIEKYV